MVSSLRFLAAITRFPLFALASTTLFGAGETVGAQLTASWADNSGGVATTQLERRLGTDTTYAVLATVAPGLTTYVDTSVSGGLTYCYRAAAYDSAGISAYSNEACGTAPSSSEVVTVGTAGTGTGMVTSMPAGIDCGPTCSATYSAGTVVRLAAAPATNSTFTGWSGACTGTAACTIASNRTITAIANFGIAATSIATYTLRVAKSGPGTVTSLPTGIRCGSDCSDPYPSGTVVTLTATPNRGAVFTGWSGGGCARTSVTCTVTVKSATAVSATFKGGSKN